jgi:hypothetical protein
MGLLSSTIWRRTKNVSGRLPSTPIIRTRTVHRWKRSRNDLAACRQICNSRHVNGSPITGEKSAHKRRPLGCLAKGLPVAAILSFLFAMALGPMPNGHVRAPENTTMQMARQIALAMFQYSVDHDGKYPDGKSSTEVFQKLIDGNYVSDPAVFYVPLAGKAKPEASSKILKPENVSWDVTGNLDGSTPDQIPVVFLTCFRVSYVPGGSAISLVKPYPRFGMENLHPGFWDLIAGRDIQWFGDAGIAVAYKSNSARFTRAQFSQDGTAVIPTFVSPDFKPNGTIYRQLTPEGSL